MTDQQDKIANCSKAELAASFVRGELSADEVLAYESHFVSCNECRVLVDDFQKIIEHIEREPREEVSRDLADAVLEQLPEDAWLENSEDRPLRFPFFPSWARAAAMFIGVACAAVLLHTSVRQLETDILAGRLSDEAPSKKLVINGALRWLAVAQGPEGAWDPAKWGGKKEYEVSLTSMSVISFIRGNGSTPEELKNKVLQKGVSYLLSQQGADGLFGPRFSGSMYNHGIATVALLEYHGQHKDERIVPRLRKALRFIADQQHEMGGWGYEKRKHAQANTSISVWQIEALALAGRLGIQPAGSSLERGLLWLKGMVDEQGQFGYQKPRDFPEGSETLTAMGAFCLYSATEGEQGQGVVNARVLAALRQVATRVDQQPDFYRWYFIASALKLSKAAEHETLLASLQDLLIQKRSSATGSWDPIGKWGTVGGRVYSTTMATMSLEDAHGAL